MILQYQPQILQSTKSHTSQMIRRKKPEKSNRNTMDNFREDGRLLTIERDLDEIDKNAIYIPWDKVKKDLGL